MLIIGNLTPDGYLEEPLEELAEEAAVSAEIMGNTVDRLYDVGVAGLHRLLHEHARLIAAIVSSSRSAVRSSPRSSAPSAYPRR